MKNIVETENRKFKTEADFLTRGCPNCGHSSLETREDNYGFENRCAANCGYREYFLSRENIN